MTNILITYFEKMGSGNFNGIEIDSRKVTDGKWFICLEGEKTHGVQFVNTAVKNGAGAIVVEKARRGEIPGNCPVPILEVEDVLSELHAFASYYRSLFKGKVIGITGSAGKTTVKEMVLAVLRSGFRCAGTVGNYNNHLGLPYSILNAPIDFDFYVFEIGTNHKGEIATLASIMKPDWSYITNIGTAHIGYFGNRDAIYIEKQELFNHTDEKGTLFINLDDPYLAGYKSTKRHITISVNSHADYTLRSSSVNSDGFAEVDLGDYRITSPLPGKHQVHNLLAAVAIGSEAGLNPDKIRSGLQSMTSISKRMEIVQKNPYVIINDAYNANKESTCAAADYLESISATGKIMVLGDIFELGDLSEQIHIEVGQYLQTKQFNHILLVGNETGAIMDAIQDERFWYTKSKDELYFKIKEIVKPGDAVLFKASRGMALETVIDKLTGE
ncbi:MAG: UDP-N-acetylmuramoyl-tripeptide--D-alanyl-D-alanine ligase [Calditrichia bacterium]